MRLRRLNLVSYDQEFINNIHIAVLSLISDPCIKTITLFAVYIALPKLFLKEQFEKPAAMLPESTNSAVNKLVHPSTRVKIPCEMLL